MDTQRRWIGYDWFKLIVALILLLLLLFLLLQRPAVPPPTSAGQVNEANTAAASQTPLPPTIAPPTASQTPPPTIAPPTASQPAQPSQTPTAVPPTATLPPAPTPTQIPATATPEPTQPPATPTPAPETASTPTATPQPQAQAGDCPLAQPSRLAVGKQAVVVANLNLRKEAGMDKPILRVSLPRSKVEIIGGPVCIPYQKGAYLWWNVKAADGTTGWSAEASLGKNFYFLDPVP